MRLASWRGERTASVGNTKDDEGWVDFGASAQRLDGKRDGGDALELEARVTQETKPKVMRQAARKLVSKGQGRHGKCGQERPTIARLGTDVYEFSGMGAIRVILSGMLLSDTAPR